jgi:hypothetical protein
MAVGTAGETEEGSPGGQGPSGRWKGTMSSDTTMGPSGTPVQCPSGEQGHTERKQLNVQPKLPRAGQVSRKERKPSSIRGEGHQDTKDSPPEEMTPHDYIL